MEKRVDTDNLRDPDPLKDSNNVKFRSNLVISTRAKLWKCKTLASLFWSKMFNRGTKRRDWSTWARLGREPDLKRQPILATTSTMKSTWSWHRSEMMANWVCRWRSAISIRGWTWIPSALSKSSTERINSGRSHRSLLLLKIRWLSQEQSISEGNMSRWVLHHLQKKTTNTKISIHLLRETLNLGR